MSEINNFLDRGNRKIVNIQVVKDFDTELTGVNYIVFYEEGADITFWFLFFKSNSIAETMSARPDSSPLPEL